MSQPFIGEIRMFGGNFAPRGWAFCNGQLQSIAENTTLFSLLGTTYGGDGQTTFGLPDLRGRVPIHFGQGAGLSARNMGEAGGAETVTLTVATMPAHTHLPAASTAAGTQTSPNGGVWSAAGQLRYSSGSPAAALNPGAASLAGGGQPHENMVPFTAVSFIIAVEGIFPSRN